MTVSPASRDKQFKKAFAQGLAAVALVYGGVYGFVSMKADETLTRIQDNLPTSIMLIDRAAPSPGTHVEQTLVLTTTNPIDTTPETEDHAQVDVPSGPLQPAPFEGLYETAPEGMLPKVSSDGTSPFDAYKRPYAQNGVPAIALAVKDYGLSAKESDEALGLPPEISLILSPYAENAEMWQKKAREAGHEVWLSLPLENDRFLQDDPGPRALLTRASLLENQRRLSWILSRATGYAGVVAETDKTFIDMHSMLGALISEVYKRGLGYFELNTFGSEFLETLAISSNGKFVQLNENNAAYNDKVFTRLEATARKNGYVTATMTLTPRNLEAVKIWAFSLSNKGVELAPISATIDIKPKPEQPVVNESVPTTLPAVSPAIGADTGPIIIKND